MGHRHQQHRSNRGRRQRIQKRIRMHNAKLRKDPPPNHRPYQPNQNIPNAPESMPARHLSRQTSRQQPDQTPLPLHNHHMLLQRHHPKHPNHHLASLLSWLPSVNSVLFLCGLCVKTLLFLTLLCVPSAHSAPLRYQFSLFHSSRLVNDFNMDLLSSPFSIFQFPFSNRHHPAPAASCNATSPTPAPNPDNESPPPRAQETISPAYST